MRHVISHLNMLSCHHDNMAILHQKMASAFKDLSGQIDIVLSPETTPKAAKPLARFSDLGTLQAPLNKFRDNNSLNGSVISAIQGALARQGNAPMTLADIHKALSPDVDYKSISGTMKRHLGVLWERTKNTDGLFVYRLKCIAGGTAAAN